MLRGAILELDQRNLAKNGEQKEVECNQNRREEAGFSGFDWCWPSDAELFSRATVLTWSAIQDRWGGLGHGRLHLLPLLLYLFLLLLALCHCYSFLSWCHIFHFRSSAFRIWRLLLHPAHLAARTGKAGEQDSSDSLSNTCSTCRTVRGSVSIPMEAQNQR